MPTLPDKTVLLTELHYLPSVAYFSQLLRYEQITIEAQEHYQKRSYRNRTHIATSHGVLALSIPLKSGKNTQQPIYETQISYDHLWQKQHWQTIASAYGNAPFWEHYAPHFERIFLQKTALLLDWNLELFQLCLKLLKVKHLDIQFSSEYLTQMPENVLDGRNVFLPNAIPSEPLQAYSQVFMEKTGFLPHLSILDLLFCCGNQSLAVVQKNS